MKSQGVQAPKFISTNTIQEISKMSKLILLISPLLLIFSMAPALAGRVEPTPVTCWFFRGEKLALKHTCIYELSSWLGGGVKSLLWEDGERTNIAWGIIGRGQKIPCEEISLDNICGSSYLRDLKTMKRISEEEVMRGSRPYQSIVDCVQVRLNSVCWTRPIR